MVFIIVTIVYSLRSTCLWNTIYWLYPKAILIFKLDVSCFFWEYFFLGHVLVFSKLVTYFDSFMHGYTVFWSRSPHARLLFLPCRSPSPPQLAPCRRINVVSIFWPTEFNGITFMSLGWDYFLAHGQFTSGSTTEESLFPSNSHQKIAPHRGAGPHDPLPHPWWSVGG